MPVRHGCRASALHGRNCLWRLRGPKAPEGPYLRIELLAHDWRPIPQARRLSRSGRPPQRPVCLRGFALLRGSPFNGPAFELHGPGQEHIGLMSIAEELQSAVLKATKDWAKVERQTIRSERAGERARDRMMRAQYRELSIKRSEERRVGKECRSR